MDTQEIRLLQTFDREALTKHIDSQASHIIRCPVDILRRRECGVHCVVHTDSDRLRGIPCFPSRTGSSGQPDQLVPQWPSQTFQWSDNENIWITNEIWTATLAEYAGILQQWWASIFNWTTKKTETVSVMTYLELLHSVNCFFLQHSSQIFKSFLVKLQNKSAWCPTTSPRRVQCAEATSSTGPVTSRFHPWRCSYPCCHVTLFPSNPSCIQVGCFPRLFALFFFFCKKKIIKLCGS